MIPQFLLMELFERVLELRDHMACFPNAGI